MGSDRAAHRDAHDSSQRGIPAICAAATPAGWNGLRNRINLFAVAAISLVLPKDVCPIRKCQWHASRGARVSFELGRHGPVGQSTEWKRMREPAERVGFQR